MTQSRVIVKDLGFKKVMAELQKAGGTHITVGVHADAKPRKDGGPLAVLVAAANEFGTDTIPERSFMRSTIDSRRQDIALLTTKLLGQVADGKTLVADASGIIGLWVSNAIKKTITDLSEPPNAPSTIARKGSSNPLIDTGQMRASITFAVVEGKKPPKGKV